MKFVLCSEGFHTPNIVEACVKLVSKSQDQISVGIMNEAYAVHVIFISYIPLKSKAKSLSLASVRIRID